MDESRSATSAETSTHIDALAAALEVAQAENARLRDALTLLLRQLDPATAGSPMVLAACVESARAALSECASKDGG